MSERSTFELFLQSPLIEFFLLAMVLSSSFDSLRCRVSLDSR
jgi:hypothetical protein